MDGTALLGDLYMSKSDAMGLVPRSRRCSGGLGSDVDWFRGTDAPARAQARTFSMRLLSQQVKIAIRAPHGVSKTV
jgi:hypothetical protein